MVFWLHSWVVLTSVASATCPAGCDCTSDKTGAGTFVDCKGRGLNRIPRSFPDDSRTIDLSDNDLVRLDEIQELEQLTTLNLANNKISEIDQDFFDDLDALTTLHLSHNRLRFIEDDVFEWGPQNVRRFYIDHNRLETITHLTFNNLESIETLDLSSNFLFFIDDNAFEDLESLTSIRLHNNSLSSFRPHWFEDIFFNSIDLTLHDNPWSCDIDTATTLASAVFDTNGSSKRILKEAVTAGNSRLECQRPEKLVGRSFFDLRKEDVEQEKEDIQIRAITASFEVNEGDAIMLRCEATGVPKPVVEWLAPDGDEYSITNDDYNDVHMHQDGTLIILHAEDLDDGDYTCVAKNTQHTMEAKTSVTVRRESSTKDFDVCPYDPVSKGFFHDMDGCVSPVEHSTKVPTATQSTQHRTFESCPRDCDCSYKNADCSEQGMTRLPSSLPQFVKTLNFQDNDVNDLDEDICEYFDWLEEILIDQNMVTTIGSGAFDSCRRMIKLTLANNQLRSLTTSQFSSLRELQTLDLSGNLIQHLPSGVFSGLVNVERIFLRDNEITQIGDDAFRSLPSLKFISLQDNHISHLTREWIEGAKSASLASIFLEGNKIECNCGLADFGTDLTSMSSSTFQLIKPDELFCSYPMSLSGKALSELDLEGLSCQEILIPPPANIKSVKSGSHFMTFVIGIICSIGISRGYQKWKIWRSRQPMPSRRRGGINDDEHSGLQPLIGGPADDERFV